MKRQRFLALIARDGALSLETCAHLEAHLLQSAGLSAVLATSRLAVFTAGAALQIDRGMIIGAVYRRDGEMATAALSTADAALTASRGEQHLIDAHWGGYVALRDEGQAVSILRAPLGDLACLIGRTPDAWVISSDTALLIAAGVATHVDFGAVARHLAAPDLRRPETCLRDIGELQGGLRLTIADNICTEEELWSPWQFAARERQIYEPEEAVQRIRDAVLHSVAASTSNVGFIILKLSGGLDSSVVAAALARADRSATALNLVTDDRAGDERHYARIAAQAVGFDLIERQRSLETVDLAASAAGNLPRPTARSFAQASAYHTARLAKEVGAGTIVDGGGGDNVFCSLQSVRPVIDCLIDGRGWASTASTARSIAALAQVSQWTVMRRAVTGRVRGVSAYAFQRDLRLLSEQAIATSVGATAHRWLRAPRDALPGKAAHIGLIAAAQSVVEGFDPLEAIPTLSPLVTQPVVEACVAVPSWLWFDGGHNRAVARAAFAGLLPEAIVRRRSKGGPDGFIAELFRRNRQQIRPWLLDGVLMANGLLDRQALEAALAEQGPVRHHDFLRVMQLGDAESWVRHWAR